MRPFIPLLLFAFIACQSSDISDDERERFLHRDDLAREAEVGESTEDF